MENASANFIPYPWMEIGAKSSTTTTTSGATIITTPTTFPNSNETAAKFTPNPYMDIYAPNPWNNIGVKLTTPNDDKTNAQASKSMETASANFIPYPWMEIGAKSSTTTTTSGATIITTPTNFPNSNETAAKFTPKRWMEIAAKSRAPNPWNEIGAKLTTPNDDETTAQPRFRLFSGVDVKIKEYWMKGKPYEWVTIFIKGYETADDETKTALTDLIRSTCLRISDILIGPDPFTRQGQGSCAYFEVWGQEAADQAVELTGTQVCGRKITVKRAPTLKDKSKDPSYTTLFGSSAA